jgi:flagellar export protein FliJ
MVRKSIERREELALQRVQFDIAELRKRIDSLTAEIDNKQSERNRALQEPTYAREVHAILSEMNAAIESRRKLTGSLKLMEQEQEKRMKAYQAAHVDRELLTNMLAQQRTSYDQEERRKQQKSIDEIFSSRASRS